MAKTNGIYCLEGFWFGTKDKTSVSPVLELLSKRRGIKTFYHRCATKAEVQCMVERWGQKTFQKDYPIIYLAAHGQENLLDFGGKAKITLDEIAELLEGKCERAIFYFGSCETLNGQSKQIKNFLERTKAIAAIGYKNEVDWLKATCLEMLILDYLQDFEFYSKYINKLEAGLKEEFKKTFKDVNLVFVANDQWFRKSNKKAI